MIRFPQFLKFFTVLSAIVCFLTFSILSLSATTAQNTAVTVEAIGQANLRAATDPAAELLGEIRAGTRYPVIGRSAFYPWLLLAAPGSTTPLGWVFRDLVTIQGDVNTVPVSEIIITDTAPPSTTATVNVTPSASDTTSTAQSPTVTPPPLGVSGTVSGEINVRYGPGVEYPRIGVARAGDTFMILMWHTQFDWVQVRYPESPTGFAWVALDLLDVQGDVYSLPSSSQTTFNLPALTPTPSQLQVTTVLGAEPVPLSPEFQALADDLWARMIAAGFDPVTSRLGALFVMDLQTGEAASFGSEIAFSGMSVNKIAILMALYEMFNAPPDDAAAFTIANAMICSENLSTNDMLTLIGDGNPYTGAERVSAFLERIGISRTFIYTPFANDPFVTPQAPRTRTTDANQVLAEPDPFNQMTVNEIGGLLNSLYQCAVSTSSPLLETGSFTQTECRQMLAVMSGNRIGNLIEAGVPVTVPIAHKHGWIEDTHGDAAIVFSPGGSYVLVVALHNPIWLNFDESSNLVADISQTVYNYFNSDAPMTEPRYELVPERCDLLGSPILDDLKNPEYGS